MKHVVIGSSGFLGRELVRLLADRDGDTVIAIDETEQPADLPAGVSFVRADIAVGGTLDAVDPSGDTVVHHLASRLITPNKPRFNRYDFFARTSVTGTRNVLDWMQAKGGKRLVFWSTDMVYGPQPKAPFDETAPPVPVGPYGRTKLIAEAMVQDAAKDWLEGGTILRPRLIIGAGRLGILEKLFNQVRANGRVPTFGQGNNRFQFVSVTDCARASILAAERGCPSDIFNLGSDNPPTVKTLLETFIANAGSRSKLFAINDTLLVGTLDFLNWFTLSPMDPEQYRIAAADMVLSTEKARKVLGWVPEHSDQDMLEAAFQTYTPKAGA